MPLTTLVQRVQDIPSVGRTGTRLLLQGNRADWPPPNNTFGFAWAPDRRILAFDTGVWTGIGGIGITGVFNVKDFGAVGDGATDDTAAILAAIAAAQANFGGGIVYFPPGIYIVSGTLSVTAPGVYLLGSGMQSTFLSSDSATLDIVDLGNTTTPFNCCGIARMSFTSTIPRTAGWAVAVAGCQEVVIEELRVVTTGGNGLRFGAGAALAAICYVSKIQVFTVGAFTAVQLDSGNDRFFDKMWLLGNSTAGSFGVQILNSGGDWFQNIESSLYEQGYRMNGGTIAYLSFINCLADQNTVRGFNFTAGAITGIEMVDCWASSSGIGANTNQGVQINVGDGYTITNLRCFNNGGPGIHIGPGAAANIEIVGAQVSGNSQGTVNTTDGIQIDAAAVNVKITGGRSTQMAGFGNTQRNGILNNSTTTNGYGCDVSTNATGTINSVAGVGVRFMNCLGFNPRGAGVAQPAVPASGTPVNNTTGQDCTVYISGGTMTGISVGGVALGLPAATTNIGVFVPAGSSITITYTVAPTWKWFGA